MTASSTSPSADLDALARRIDDDLSAIRRAVRRQLEESYESGGLTGPQKLAMEIVIRQGPLPLKAIAAAMNLGHSTVSGIMQRLEARGFVAGGGVGERLLDVLQQRAAVAADQLGDQLDTSRIAHGCAPCARAFAPAAPAVPAAPAAPPATWWAAGGSVKLLTPLIELACISGSQKTHSASSATASTDRKAA